MGAITRPHGIRGELCVDCYAELPSVLSAPLTLVFADGHRERGSVLAKRPHKNMWLVQMKGVGDRTAAERLVGCTLWVDRRDIPAPDENEAFLADLIGRPVSLADGTPVGLLDHVEFPAGQMLWAIRNEDSEMLFPARPEFLLSLDDPIVIDPPEGLLEACRTPLKKS